MERSRTREGGGEEARVPCPRKRENIRRITARWLARVSSARASRVRTVTAASTASAVTAAVACHRATREGRAGLGEPGPCLPRRIEPDAMAGSDRADRDAIDARGAFTDAPTRARAEREDTSRRLRRRVLFARPSRGSRTRRRAFVARSASLWRRTRMPVVSTSTESKAPCRCVTAHQGKSRVTTS